MPDKANRQRSDTPTSKPAPLTVINLLIQQGGGRRAPDPPRRQPRSGGSAQRHSASFAGPGSITAALSHQSLDPMPQVRDLIEALVLDAVVDQFAQCLSGEARADGAGDVQGRVSDGGGLERVAGDHT